MRIYQNNEIQAIVQAFKKGDIIAFPTDTVFGLGCMYNNVKAEEKIYQAKNRDRSKKLPLMLDSKERLFSLFNVNEIEEKLIKSLMPGAFTIVLNTSKTNESYAVRIADDKLINSIIKELDCPLLVTSANISNEKSLYLFDDVVNCLDGRIDGIVKGDAQNDQASTIVEIVSNKIQVLREGKINLEMIERIINE